MNGTIHRIWKYAALLCLLCSAVPAHAAEGARVPLDGACNLRDLGGCPAADGRTVKRGLLYRADALDALTGRDVAALERLGLRTVVDFRSRKEAAEAPDRLPATVRDYIQLPLLAGNVYDRDASPYGEGAAGMMRGIYAALPHDGREQYAAFFRLLADPRHRPLLFHCTAGKDRTGLAAALFLSALGVEREAILDDYLRSAAYVEPRFRAVVERKPELADAYTVRREYLETAFAEIAARYGGIGNYLREELGVDVDGLRAAYLE